MSPWPSHGRVGFLAASVLGQRLIGNVLQRYLRNPPVEVMTNNVDSVNGAQLDVVVLFLQKLSACKVVEGGGHRVGMTPSYKSPRTLATQLLIAQANLSTMKIIKEKV